MFIDIGVVSSYSLRQILDLFNETLSPQIELMVANL